MKVDAQEVRSKRVGIHGMVVSELEHGFPAFQMLE